MPNKKILADTMNWEEMEVHKKDNGIVILPMGCFEMHGVQIPLGCDTFEAEAASVILAEEWDAVVLPSIHYTYPGATSPWAGSIGVKPSEITDYTIAVVKGIFNNGFKRVVIVSLHGPSNWYIPFIIRTVFEETGNMAVFSPVNIYPFWDAIKEEFGPHSASASVFAALHILGRHGEYDPSATEEETIENAIPCESFKKLQSHGAQVPYRYAHPEDHVGRYPGLSMDNVDRCVELFRESVLEKAKGFPEDYSQFQEDMQKIIDDAPWNK